MYPYLLTLVPSKPKPNQSLIWFNYSFVTSPLPYVHLVYTLYNLKFYKVNFLPPSMYRFTMRSLFKLTFQDFRALMFTLKRTYITRPKRKPLTVVKRNFFVHNFDRFRIRRNVLLSHRKRRFFRPNRALKRRVRFKFLVLQSNIPRYRFQQVVASPYAIRYSLNRASKLRTVLRKGLPFSPSKTHLYRPLPKLNVKASYTSSNRNFRLVVNAGLSPLFASRKVRNFHLITSSLVGLKHIRLRIVNFFKRSHAPHNSVYGLTTLFKRKAFAGRGIRWSHDIPTSLINSFKYLVHFRSVFFNRRPAYFKIAHMTRRYITPQRREFMLWFRKKLRYQKRITKYVLKFYRFKVLEFFNQFELTLTWILFKARLVSTLSTAGLLIKARYVYVNGSLVTNPSLDTTVYPFDVIQLKFTMKLFMFFKWQYHLDKQLYYNFRKYIRYWNSRKFRQYPKLSSYRIPHWVIHTRFFFETVPQYLEINYGILTIFILHTNLWNLARNYKLSSLVDPVASARNFNWKSIN